MTDIPNCSNCDKGTFTRGENWLNGGVLCDGKELLPDGVATIKIKGCLSHPQAREYLMKDVIEELERRIDTLSKEAAQKDNYCLSYRAAGIAEVIALVRNGVEK